MHRYHAFALHIGTRRVELAWSSPRSWAAWGIGSSWWLGYDREELTGAVYVRLLGAELTID